MRFVYVFSAIAALFAGPVELKAASAKDCEQSLVEANSLSSRLEQVELTLRSMSDLMSTDTATEVGQASFWSKHIETIYEHVLHIFRQDKLPETIQFGFESFGADMINDLSRALHNIREAHASGSLNDAGAISIASRYLQSSAQHAGSWRNYASANLSGAEILHVSQVARRIALELQLDVSIAELESGITRQPLGKSIDLTATAVNAVIQASTLRVLDPSQATPRVLSLRAILQDCQQSNAPGIESSMSVTLAKTNILGIQRSTSP